MNLIIDKGNTRSKIAVFKGEEIVFIHKTDVLSCSFLERLFRQYPIHNAILSTVSGIQESVLNFLHSQCKFINFSVEIPMPIKLSYATLKTLGSDRIAAVLGAYFFKPQENFIVIDCGTCITYEVFIGGCYLGGCILPGMDMRFRALNSYTVGLPIVKPQANDELFGNDTIISIRTGVQNGIVYEIEGFLSRIKDQYGDLDVFLTGGDALFFEKCLKSRIFAVENLTLIGLNGLIEYNA